MYKTTIEIDEEDIKDILAKHFSTKPENIFLYGGQEECGCGQQTHSTSYVKAKITSYKIRGLEEV